MACPACSRRALGLFIEGAGGINSTTTALLRRPRRLPPPTTTGAPLRQQARPRALSTWPALRAPASFRLPDVSQAGADDDGSRDAIVPSNVSPEPRDPAAAEQQRHDADAVAVSDGERVVVAVESAGVAADPDPAELRKDLGLTQEAPEEDVQFKLWRLTGGLSGTPPPKEPKETRKQRKERRKLEKKWKVGGEAGLGPGGAQAEKTTGEQAKKTTGGAAPVAEIITKGGYPRVVPYEKVKRKSAMKVKQEAWKVQKEALQEKFGEQGWQPRKRLSPDAMDGIRTLHKSDPDRYTTPVLADEFKVSPEAIRRILRSKWRPNEGEEEDRMKRWEKRGEKIWTTQVEQGKKPPKKWRVMGVGSVHGGKDDLPAWKQKRGWKGKGQDDRLGFSRPRGPGADYGDEGGWNERIL